MTIKITDKILSIPPYISAHWSRIATLHMKGNILQMTLVDGDALQIPNLDTETIRSIFEHHATFIENEHTPTLKSTPFEAPGTSAVAKLQDLMKGDNPSIQFAFGTSIDGMGGMLQHDPTQKDAPDIPEEVIKKIAMIGKIMGPSDSELLPKSESSCNCFHCQIARALNPDSPIEIPAEEEAEIDEKDLQFQQWTITQTNDKLFSVVNRLDDKEKYNVYLGEPVGCTCGKPGCEHILAVLKS